MRDDFSLSDTGAQEEYCEDIIDEEIVDEDGDDERRERQFFGDEEYTILSNVPEEDEQDQMSMTMQQREQKELQERVASLRKEISQLQIKINMQKELGEHLAGKSVIFQELIDKYEQLSKNVENTTEE